MTAAITVLAGVLVLGTFDLSADATHQPNHPDVAALINVVFTPNRMGFEVTSSKDISNIWVLYCDLVRHEHTSLKGLVYNHTELETIRGVWVKSGSNGNAANDPPGAGTFVTYLGACIAIVPGTTPPSTPPTTPATTAPSTAANRTTAAPTTEIPFFPSATALALASIGALAGAFLVMRRKN